MKKNFLSAVMMAAVIVSCTKSSVKTESTENPDGSITTTTTVSENGLGVDTAKINHVKENAQATINEADRKIDNAAEEARNKIDATADRTKKNLHEAGEDIRQGAKEVGRDVKDAAAKGASKVEEGARKLKEDLKK